MNSTCQESIFTKNLPVLNTKEVVRFNNNINKQSWKYGRYDSNFIATTDKRNWNKERKTCSRCDYSHIRK